MRRTRSRIFRALSAVAAALALACSFEGTALAAANARIHEAAPAEQVRPAATSVRWHTLTLLNGWASSQSRFDSGDPAVAIQRGVVYLSGSMHQATGTSSRFAIMPRGFRPAHNLWLPVYSYGGTDGSIEIAVSGQMTAFGGDVAEYTSLAGISFPVRSVPMHNLSLLNGWTSSQGQYNSGNPQAGVQNGVVYLAGSMHQASGTNTNFAILPTKLRPGQEMGLPAYIYASEGVGLVEIYANGQMRVFGAVAINYTSLAGMSFPVRSVRFRNLSLVNGWISASSVSGKQAGVGIQNGIVYLAGGITRSSGTSDQFATLPPAFRPAHNLWLPVHTFLGKTGAIEIARTGQMYAFGGDAIAFSGLSGISFPVSS